jgi:large subunit ribosomal protein L13
MSFVGQRLQRCWHLVDARGQVVGRLANQIAQILKGKHKPTFHPSYDMGDNVVVINAEKVKFTGDKWKKKLYRWHTGYPGGLRTRRAEEMLEKNPTQILRKAIMGMLRRNNLRHGYLEKRLNIYVGPDHPHTAQLPPGRVEPIPRVPLARHGEFHFGLEHYAHPNSYLEGRNPPEAKGAWMWAHLQREHDGNNYEKKVAAVALKSQSEEPTAPPPTSSS